VTGGHRLEVFLYLLLRDHLPSGVAERIMLDVDKASTAPSFSNPHTAAHAAEIAHRLCPKRRDPSAELAVVAEELIRIKTSTEPAPALRDMADKAHSWLLRAMDPDGWYGGAKVRAKSNHASVWTVTHPGKPGGLFWTGERSQGMPRDEFELVPGQ
jgi:hypothetical protein